MEHLSRPNWDADVGNTLDSSTLNNAQHPLRDWRFMKYAIIGSGKIGTALARTFARHKVEVAIANTRGPKMLASLAEELGPTVLPQSVQDACQAEIIFLAVPFPAHQEIAKKFKQWNGKIVVDVTNALDVAPEELGGLLSSEVVSQAFVGARLVKAFNHLPAAQLGTNPLLEGQQQVVFISSNDADASATVAAAATQLGFAPIELGRLDRGGVPLHAVNGEPGGLLFQNVEKLIGENYEQVK
jgi:8-hydroxy-5-deazaflavin:NADPH oxidoreductase